jgi:4-alpha-glucanotransferase
VKSRKLRELARLYDIQSRYVDASGKEVRASNDSLRAAVAARIGEFELDDALRARRSELDSRVVEPVIVAWEREKPRVEDADGEAYELVLEDGQRRTGTIANGVIDEELPHGYHALRVGDAHDSLLICAPRKAFAPTAKSWGIFAPLYAAHTPRTWGIGDLGDLEAYRLWINELGGGIVATLPMLASFHDSDPSPYSPVSRLFWNELYIDVTRLPEYRGEPLEPLPTAGDVDYSRVMAAKRRLLEQLAERATDIDDRHDELAAYARFRESRGDGSARYHRYVQTRMSQQMRVIADDARARGLGLYLDFPLGVSAGGYDAQRFSGCFAKGSSVGAPPDLFFTKGQNWGFPPLDPDASRASRHNYFRACIRHHVEHAGILRIDHHMGLHRLFWIPSGAEAKDGVYVHYPADELYAILTLESHRNRCVILGEDLGTVPPEVPAKMQEHGIRRMYVVQYESKPDGAEPIGAPAKESVASINTHDMPTFAGFWRGDDIGDRVEQHLLDERGAVKEQQTRERMRKALRRFLEARGLLDPASDDTVAVLEAVLGFLGSSDAEIVLVNLEDLWLEPEPQNVPGAGGRSWRRRMRLGLEAARHDATTRRILRTVDQTRRQEDGNQK